MADAPGRPHVGLLERLNAAPSSPAAWFAVLWTYYADAQRLRETENALLARAVFPQRLRPLDESSFAAVQTRIRGACAAADDATLLRGLIWLDRMIASLPGRALAGHTFEGIDGRRHRVIRRRNLIADVLAMAGHLQTESADQSPTIHTYGRRTTLVPVDPVNGIRIEHRSTWPDEVCAAIEHALAFRTFSVLLWPFDGSADDTVRVWEAATGRQLTLSSAYEAGWITPDFQHDARGLWRGAGAALELLAYRDPDEPMQPAPWIPRYWRAIDLPELAAPHDEPPRNQRLPDATAASPRFRRRR